MKIRNRRWQWGLLLIIMVVFLTTPVSLAEKPTWELVNKGANLYRTSTNYFQVNAHQDELAHIELILPYLDSFYKLDADLIGRELSYKPIELHFTENSNMTYTFGSKIINMDSTGIRLPYLIHEVMHAFVRDAWLQAPKWFSEGAAEYATGIRFGYQRFTFNCPNDSYPRLWSGIDTYAGYVSVLLYLDKTYGPLKAKEWIKACCSLQSIEKGTVATLGRSSREVETGWANWLRNYQPDKESYYGVMFTNDKDKWRSLFVFWTYGTLNPENYQAMGIDPEYQVVLVVCERNNPPLTTAEMAKDFPGLAALLRKGGKGPQVIYEKYNDRLQFYVVGDNQSDIVKAAMGFDFKAVIYKELKRWP